MNGTAVSVTDAARDFFALVERVEHDRESAVITREGRPVATLVPTERAAVTCGEAAELWKSIPRLAAEEADEFADDIEAGIRALPALKSPWD